MCEYVAVPRRRGPGKNVRGTSRRPGRRAGAGGGKAKAGRADDQDRGPSLPEATGTSERPSVSAPPGPGLTASFPYTRPAFEPQLSGPVPSYPGLAYRPPSSSSSAASRPFVFLSVRPGPSRSATSASGSVSESVQSSTTTTSSAPSLPDSEEPEGAYIDMTELETYSDFQGLHIRQHRPPSRDPPQ